MTTAIVDFSALFHRLWHINHDEAVFKCLDCVRRIEEDRVIIAIDSPPYKRKDIDPQYKANRDIPDPELVGSMRTAIEALATDGYEIASCEGWEADDVIGTLACSSQGVVYGADKDLFQLTHYLIDPVTREIKSCSDVLGINWNQVIDYLCLVGDASDNIRGVTGIGAVTARKMLEKYGSLDGILKAVEADATSDKPAFTEKTRNALHEAQEWLDTTRDLVTIRTDLDVTIEKREVKPIDMSTPEIGTSIEVVKDEPKILAKVEDVGFRNSLEPLGIDQAFKFCQMAMKTGLYQQFKGPEQMMIAVMRGRQLGLDATTSLDSTDIILGKPTLQSKLIAGIIMASPQCEFLECMYFGDDKSIWETKRVGGRGIRSREYTMEEAVKAGVTVQPEYEWRGNKKVKTGRIIPKDAWQKQPGVMLQWRCVTALARQVYPDIMLGIYGREEFE